MKKQCEVCGTRLPESYGNLLCDDHYAMLVKEQEQKKAEEEAERAKMHSIPDVVEEIIQESSSVTTQPPPPSTGVPVPNHGIKDPAYTCNPEMEDKDQVLANIAQFMYSKKMLWVPQRHMYNFVKNYCMRKSMSHPQWPKHIWRPRVVDIGCGSGVGSNILSMEADIVWGIDKNQLSIDFCNETLKRERNGIYYSSQLTFDRIDIMQENRQMMEFDIVVAIEIIEHIENTHLFLMNISKFARKNKSGSYELKTREGNDFSTEFFISTPNRNNAKIRKDRPQNIYHVREWTAQEFYGLLKHYFKNVEILSFRGEALPTDTDVTPILAKCSIPLIYESGVTENN